MLSSDMRTIRSCVFCAISVMMFAAASPAGVIGWWRFNGDGHVPCDRRHRSQRSGAYVKGIFDNIRISPGVLDPSEFMGVELDGMFMSVK